MTATITFDQASVFYGEVVGLSNVSLELEPGITGVVGPNGCGKTTLMRAITGLLAPVEGTVRVLGGNPFSDASIRNRMTFVPANTSFHDNLSARKNLEVSLLAKGHTGARAQELADRGLELVRLSEHAKRSFGTLSRGMRQRVKLALALAAESELVLLDEPFLGVDPPNRKQLRDIIHEMGASGRTVVVTSHVLHEVESLTSRVGVFAHGRLLGFGQVEGLLEEIQEKHPLRMKLVCPEPRKLGALLLAWDHVVELRIVEGKVLEFVTEHPEQTYTNLPRLVAEAGVPVESLETLDHSLEAVFEHVTTTGTRRL